MDVFDSDISSFSISERYKDRVRAALEGHQERLNKAAEPKTPGPSRFSTDYAIAYGRSVGWKLIDRERYDVRTRRHHDLLLGADALMERPDGLVLIQGAGLGERAAHWRRFEEAGGVEKARKFHMAFLYAEFERGSKNPVKEEWWA